MNRANFRKIIGIGIVLVAAVLWALSSMGVINGPKEDADRQAGTTTTTTTTAEITTTDAAEPISQSVATMSYKMKLVGQTDEEYSYSNEGDLINLSFHVDYDGVTIKAKDLAKSGLNLAIECRREGTYDSSDNNHGQKNKFNLEVPLASADGERIEVPLTTFKDVLQFKVTINSEEGIEGFEPDVLEFTYEREIPSELLEYWDRGTFDEVGYSLNYHFKKHGREVGSNNIVDYCEKAAAYRNQIVSDIEAGVDMSKDYRVNVSRGKHQAHKYKHKTNYQFTILMDEGYKILSYGK